MGERPLPSALPAERSVLGAALLDPVCVPELASVLTEQDFQLSHHRSIWAAMVALSMAGEPIDTVSVGAALKARGLLEKVGGYGYLTQLTDETPSVANALRYASLVRAAADRREIIAAAQDAIEAAYGSQDPTEIRSSLQTRMQGIGGASSQWVDIAEVGPRIREPKAKEAGFDVGLRDLQFATGGLYEGLNAVSGMPGAGKTTLCLQLTNRAILSGHLAAIVSADQSRDDLFLAQWCNMAKLDDLRVRGDDGAVAYKRLIESRTSYYEGKFDLASILGGIRIMAAQGYRWVLVDYLGLIHVAGQRPAEGAETAAKALKLLSRELHLTVLLVISFTKPEDANSPKMEEARGTLEVAHTVEQMWLMQGASDPAAPTFCHIVKSRHAGRGKVQMELRGAQHRFTDWGALADA